MKFHFHVGDRVKMIEPVDDVKFPSLGTVVTLDEDEDTYSVGVEFDENFDGMGHGLDGYPTSRGWYCTEKSLELVEAISPIEIENLI